MLSFDNATIGVNTDNINTYLDNVRVSVIEDAINILKKSQETMFELFRNYWVGQSEAIFEQNMQAATEKVIVSLDAHYTVFDRKIRAINNAWIEQDAAMVERRGV